MVYKLILLIFFIGVKIGYTNIIYDKNKITVTEIEMNIYKNLYKTNYEKDISNNETIKNIVLIKKTINYLINNNPDFILKLDENIKKEYSDEILNNKSVLNFIRFQKIRNEFISDYFQNIFSIEDLKIIFLNFDGLKLPISKNNCLTIEKLYEVSYDENFIENFFKNLKNKKQKIKTLVNNELYDVCFNNKSYQNIENQIIKFIKNKTENDFNNYIYSKIN